MDRKRATPNFPARLGPNREQIPGGGGGLDFLPKPPSKTIVMGRREGARRKVKKKGMEIGGTNERERKSLRNIYG